MRYLRTKLKICHRLSVNFAHATLAPSDLIRLKIAFNSGDAAE